jgi:soluble lytic murein transglycosylase-like protein
LSAGLSRFGSRRRIDDALVATVVGVQALATEVPSARSNAHSSDLVRFGGVILEASVRFSIPQIWIRAAMHQESGGIVRIVSPKGAIGLMQVMPKTYFELARRYGLGPDPFNFRDNILAGAAYLREMQSRFGSPGLWPHTMQDRGAMNSTFRPAARCHTRR